MRVTSVELRPEGSSDIIDLSFRDPKSLNPYRVKSFSTLDADELVPQFYGTSGDSTKKYNNLTLVQREPVALIGLNPRFGAATENSYSELRDRLFRLISSSRTGLINIVFMNGEQEVAFIAGTVSKFESSLFTKTPEVQITFSCKDTMLRSLERVTAFDGPGWRNTLTLDAGDSTAPSGFRFTARIDSPTDRFVMMPPDGENSLDVRPVGGFQMSDVLTFSSEHRSKELYFTRAGVRTYLADVIEPNGIWPIMFPGITEYVVNQAVTWLTCDHYRTYWGV